MEEDTAAQRAVHNLPLQLSVDDHQTARDALDALRRKDGKQVLPDHKIPSENNFEKKSKQCHFWSLYVFLEISFPKPRLNCRRGIEEDNGISFKLQGDTSEGLNNQNNIF